MAKLKWDKSNERLFETGVSECVLYVKGDDGYEDGVAWNGVTAITNSPSGAEATALYADNIKYLNLLSAEEFAATIEAYMAPDAFAECDGTAELSATVKGVTLGQQPRKQFALAYKTIVGNDGKGNDFGYKIHIIYGCLAAPSERAYATVNDSPEAITLSWEVSTTPVEVEGFKATSYVCIDSTKFTAATKAKLDSIVNSLYGTDPTPTETEGTAPTLLMPDDILAILNAA